MDVDTQATGSEAPAETTAADTVETQPSEANVQNTNETPEATQENEEKTEVKAEDTVEDKLYAGKYKSVEEMEKAYQELNTKATRDAMEKAELTRILNEAFSTPESAPQSVESDDLYADESNTPNQGEGDGVKRDLAVVKFTIAHQDADGKAMLEVLNSDPLVSNINSYDAKLEYAYLRSQNMAQSKALEEAKKQGAQSAQAKIAEKQVAQVETAVKTAAKTDEKSELQERMSSGSLIDREAARKQYIRKYLV